MKAVVVGAIGRDLVLEIDEMPSPGGSTHVTARRELLGGKGANQAVAGRDLGAAVALVAVVGDDAAGRAMLAEARADGIDVAAVAVRPGAPTALLVDVVEPGGIRRLLEHAPAALDLSPAEVRAAGPAFVGADVVFVQLQTAADAALEALRLAASAGALVVTDGSPATDEVRAAVLATATVVRADSAEAAGLLGWSPSDEESTVRACRELLARGPRLVALGTSGADIVAWEGGHVVLPHHDEAVDPTGGGDVFTVALGLAVAAGVAPERAARRASAASGQVVAHAGGRPELNADALP